MSKPTNTPKPILPSQEQIAKLVLPYGANEIRRMQLANDAPIWSRKLRIVKALLGDQIYIELLPSLALRVRCRATGIVYAQSLPNGQFEEVDLATTNEEATDLESIFERWLLTRETTWPSGPTEEKVTRNYLEERARLRADAKGESLPSIDEMFTAWKATRETRFENPADTPTTDTPKGESAQGTEPDVASGDGSAE